MCLRAEDHLVINGGRSCSIRARCTGSPKSCLFIVPQLLDVCRCRRDPLKRFPITVHTYLEFALNRQCNPALKGRKIGRLSGNVVFKAMRDPYASILKDDYSEIFCCHDGSLPTHIRALPLGHERSFNVNLHSNEAIQSHLIPLILPMQGTTTKGRSQEVTR